MSIKRPPSLGPLNYITGEQLAVVLKTGETTKFLVTQ